MMARYVFAALLPLLLSSASAARADGSHSLSLLMLETATTSNEHKLLATHFRSEAERARVAMRRHEWMSGFYGGKQGTWSGRNHCNRLAKRFGEMAAEYEELAKLHEAAAGGAK
jgi:hypothetical protein